MAILRTTSNVTIIRVDDVNQVKNNIKNFVVAKKIDTLLIFGHGSDKGIQLGNNNKTTDFITKQDIEKNNLFSSLNQEAVVVLFSCSSKEIANSIYRNNKNIKVFFVTESFKHNDAFIKTRNEQFDFMVYRKNSSIISGYLDSDSEHKKEEEFTKINTIHKENNYDENLYQTETLTINKNYNKNYTTITESRLTANTSSFDRYFFESTLDQQVKNENTITWINNKTTLNNTDERMAYLLSIEQIASIYNEKIINNLHKEQLAFLNEQQISMLTNQDLINKIKLDKVKFLKKEQIKLLRNAHLINALPPENVKCLTSTQIPLLVNINLVNSLEKDQMGYLEKFQIALLYKRNLVNLVN